MKLLYICHLYLPTEKAHGVQIANTCASFVDAGLDVELVVPQVRGKEQGDIYAYYNVPRTFRITRIARPDFTRFGAIGFLVHLFIYLWKAKRYARKQKPDICYTREPFAGIFFRNHFLALHAYPHHGIKWYHRLMYRRTAGIITITNVIKEQMKEWGVPEEKMFVAGNGVSESLLEIRADKPEARSYTGLPQKRKIIGYLGKYKTPFGSGKGVDELIRAFPRIRERVPEAFLMLVGINTESVEHVKSLCEEAGLTEEDYFIKDHALRADVPYYLRSADVLVMNYPYSYHHAYQMSSMKLRDYMAAERPIVASDMPSMREIINEENAVLIPPDDEDALVEALTNVLGSPDYARGLAARARAAIEGNTWENRARRIVAFMQERLTSRN